MTAAKFRRIGLFGGPLLGLLCYHLLLPPYAADVIFLFMGGFIIGLAIERWGLDRRIAFFTLRLVGARPGEIVGRLCGGHRLPEHVGFQYRFAAMMVPIAMSVIDLVLRRRTGAGLKASGGIPRTCSPAQLAGSWLNLAGILVITA